MKTDVKGRYRLKDDLYLRTKAENTTDPVHVFYAAILTSLTYESYFGKVGHIQVMKEGFKANPVSARDEILYCRRNQRIEDG